MEAILQKSNRQSIPFHCHVKKNCQTYQKSVMVKFNSDGNKLSHVLKFNEKHN